MDFAKKILNKYGWKEGDGLGKNNNGIVKPLKATLKFDNAGLGADLAASDFNNHWWERVFNDAARNVKVDKEANGDVKMNLADPEDAVEITTKGYSVRKLKKAKEDKASLNKAVKRERSDARYEGFLQAATLTEAGGEVACVDRVLADEIGVGQYKVLTDEELFRACGGRTAHKGARHGLKLNGKLQRLEQQERELLSKMQEKIAADVKENQERLDDKSSKKKKRKRCEIGEPSAEEKTITQINEDCDAAFNAAEKKISNEPSSELEEPTELRRRKKSKKKSKCKKSCA